jgi:hypothetical protein
MCKNHHNAQNRLDMRLCYGKSTRIRYNPEQFLSKFET